MTGSKTNEGFVVDPKDQNYNDKGGVGVGVGGPDGGVVGGSYAHLTAGELKKAKCKVMWNVVVISFAFMLLFTAFQSMANLQSSINRVRNPIQFIFLLASQPNRHNFTVRVFVCLCVCGGEVRFKPSMKATNIYSDTMTIKNYEKSD